MYLLYSNSFGSRITKLASAVYAITKHVSNTFSFLYRAIKKDDIDAAMCAKRFLNMHTSCVAIQSRFKEKKNMHFNAKLIIESHRSHLNC